jgi:pimeloyl-ACP methyl ester carboxylesterase
MNSICSFRFILIRFLLTIVIGFSVLITSSVRADIVLLIHGFNSNATTWHKSGINQYLHWQGWQSQGTLVSPQQNIVMWQPDFPINYDSQHTVYNANLSSRSPLEIQRQQLISMIQWLNKKHPNEAIYLIGHSLGGLVARYAAVYLFLQYPENAAPNNIAGIITIASPHLGTPRAIEAIDAVESIPFFLPAPGWRFMRSILGGDDYQLVKESQALLFELFPPKNNQPSFISWLNQQPHPFISYYSIMRYSNDDIVPPYSQNMNNIPILRGQNITLFSHSDHYLSLSDGVIIHEILKLNQ